MCFYRWCSWMGCLPCIVYCRGLSAVGMSTAWCAAYVSLSSTDSTIKSSSNRRVWAMQEDFACVGNNYNTMSMKY